MENEYYTTKDVQEWFSCSHTTAYRIMRKSNIRVVRLGKNLRIPPQEFERLIAERTETLSDD